MNKQIKFREDLKKSRFEHSGYIFREDSYGIIKRVIYIVEQIEVIRVKLNLKAEDIKILDVGCGTGIGVTIPLAMAGYDIHGIDIDQASIDRAKQISAQMPNISFSCLELDTLTASEPFHVIICSEVLEHVQKPATLLQNIRSFLTDFGLLIITVPNGYGYFELESHVYERFPNLVRDIDTAQQYLVKRYGNNSLRERHEIERSREYCDMACPSLDNKTTHCNKFTSTSIRQLIESAGYKIIQFRNRTFLAGNIINVMIRECDTLLSWNGKVADYLPKWMCSDWIIAAIKN